MSEQKNSFMATLDEWTSKTILEPWYAAVEHAVNHRDDPMADEALWQLEAVINKAVRGKILESYRNGQAAGRNQGAKGGRWTK